MRVVCEAGAAGTVDGEVVVTVKRGETRSEVRCAVRGWGVDPVTAYPARLVLPRPSPGGPVYNATCLLRSADGVPFVVKAAAPTPGVTVGGAGREAAALHTVEITLDPTAEGVAYPLAVRLVAATSGGEFPVEIVIDRPPPGGSQ